MNPTDYETISKDAFYRKDADRLRFAMNAAGIGVWELDTATNRVVWDDRCRELFGLAKDNALPYEEAIRYIHPHDLPEVKRRIEAALRGEDGGAYNATYRTIGADDGRLRWVNFTGTAYFDEEGQVTRFGGVAHDVTAMHKAQEKVRHSQEQIIALLEQSSVAISVNVRPGLTFIAANAYYAQLVGRRPEDIIGKMVDEVFPELAGKGFDERLNGVLNTGVPFYANEAGVELVKGGKKEMVYVNFSYQPLYDENDAVSSVLTIATDVTPQVTARRRIEASEARFRSLIEEAPVATCLFVGRELKIEVANEAMIHGWGKGRSVIGQPLAEALPELQGQHFLPLLDNLFTTGQPYQAKSGRADLVVDGDLKTFYFDYDFKPLRNADGEVYAIMETAIDVTEQVLARRKIEENEVRFRSLVEQAPVAMFIFRGETMVMDAANQRALAMIGRTENAVGKPLLEAVSELAGSDAYQVLFDVYHNGEARYGNEVLVPLVKDGVPEDRYFNFTYLPFRENGQVVGVIDVAVEVTDMVLARKKIEDIVAARTKELANANQSLSNANAELQRSNRNLEEFAHAASHDLKEPIRKIRFFTTRLKEQLQEQLSEEQSQTFARITKASERMGLLVDDLLVFSHVSQRPMEKGPVDLNAQLATVLEDLELDIAEKEAAIEAETLPTVSGYRRQLQQLFQNLVSNALKYSKTGEAPRITVRAGHAERHGQPFYRIEVRDNGIGFDQEYAEKIFQMFTRLHGKHEYDGTGVGLAIVRKIVENHGGYIEVESESGVGSTFFVHLPAR